ncbi:MAG: hypothetical protein GX775_06625 [Erysipelothrix sp.]|nr:hypothetical protein [Erysipelothrix sp.]
MSKDSTIMPYGSGNYVQQYFHNIYLSAHGKTLTLRLSVNVNIYYYNSFRQINQVLGTALAITSNGNWVVESPVTSYVSTTGQFPTTSVRVNASATAAIRYGDALTASYTYAFLSAVGFNVSTSTTTTTYIRRFMSSSYTISL